MSRVAPEACSRVLMRDSPGDFSTTAFSLETTTIVSLSIQLLLRRSMQDLGASGCFNQRMEAKPGAKARSRMFPYTPSQLIQLSLPRSTPGYSVLISSKALIGDLAGLLS